MSLSENMVIFVLSITRITRKTHEIKIKFEYLSINIPVLPPIGHEGWMRLGLAKDGYWFKDTR